MSRSFRRIDWSNVFYTEQGWGLADKQLLFRLRPHAQSWPVQQVVFGLRTTSQNCLALNPLKANYKSITVIAFLKMTMQHVVEGTREEGALVLSLFVSSSSGVNSFLPCERYHH